MRSFSAKILTGSVYGRKTTCRLQEWAQRYVTLAEWNEAKTFLEKSTEDVKQREATAQEERERRFRDTERLAQAVAERAKVAEKYAEQEKETASRLRRLALVAGIAASVAFVLLVVSILLGLSYMAHQTDEEQKLRATIAQHALTDSFFRTIGLSNEGIPTGEEREALWDLAQLDRINAAVRSDLLNRWFATADAFKRGDARDGQGFRAATGLNVEDHRLAMANAARLGANLATALESRQITNSSQLLNIGGALAAVANKMDPQAAVEIVTRGARGLAAAVENPQETDSARLSILNNALVALVDKIEPQAVVEIAKGLAAALENPQETNSDRLSSLSNALVALVDKIEPQGVVEMIAKGLATALENPQETNSDRLSNLRQSGGCAGK